MANHQTNIQKIAVLTSGGDAPGMNSAIRAVVRTCTLKSIDCVGVLGGYQGLLDNQIEELRARSMANILQRGGTVLKTGRCLDFLKAEKRTLAVENLRAAGVGGLVCIGGDGSFTGAHALWKEHGFPIVGVPGTIDNDLVGTEFTIGFDTAVNTALEAIDKIRDTAASHDRLFIVEVMGRDTGFIAASVGLAGGAEEIFAPDFPVPIDRVVEKIRDGNQKGKKSSILIAAEGQKPGRAYDLADQIRKRSGFDAKVSILGHQQRGGSPTASDRILASRLGNAAVDLLLSGNCDVMVGVHGQDLITTPFEIAISRKKQTPQEYLKLAQILSV